MAQTTKRAAPVRRPDPDSAPARRIDLGRAGRLGLIGGSAAVFVSAVGMVSAFDQRPTVDPFVTLGYVILFLIPSVFGYVAGRPPRTLEGQEPVPPGRRNMAAGALAGIGTGVLLALLVVVAEAFNLRQIFVNISPAMVDTLAFGQSLPVGIVWLMAGSVMAGTLGGTIHLLARRWQRPVMTALLWVFTIALLEDLVVQLFQGLGAGFLVDVLFATGGGLSLVGAAIVSVIFFGLASWLDRRPPRLRRRWEAMGPSERQRWAAIGIAVAAVVLYFTPIVMGRFMSEILDIVGIYLLMALGLNIVVGFAGLLDLGYVAFFAVGAYVTAVLTSPDSPTLTPELIFWTALPLVVLAAAFSGVLVGTPVLRMRGDYLAIVTLGFGEIARILFLSDWLRPFFGGAQGITQIPNPSVGALEINDPQTFFYPIAVLVLMAAYVTWALANSRIGRAWNAMREDEMVAEALGVNIVTAKLSAFVVGAALASFAGAIFASKIGAIFPNSFTIVVSIIVLVIIIVGGMGNLVGVAVGALVVQGLPQLLREFEEYRFLLYGSLLIFMMLVKPEGLVPSQRRVAELHQEEMAQDSWLRDQQDPPDRSAEGAETDRHVGLT